ncbi:restriction endonuclease subunit S [Candidatus Saccharibacteria bacterium]|nr:restriction endonuclease subunit S [Candidatus Saccharibacteria bacterium]
MPNSRLVRLGDYIKIRKDANSNLSFGANDVMGVSQDKRIIETKAKLSDNDLSKFMIVHPNDFIYNPRNARAIAINDLGRQFIISWNNSCFYVDSDELLPEYLNIIFRCEAYDDYVQYYAWGSSTEVFGWDKMLDYKIPLPTIEKQKEYVAMYSNLLRLSKNHEKSFDELQKLTDLFMDAMVEKYESKEIGNYIELVNKRNKGGFITDVRGVNIDKEFMPSVANLSGVDLSKYKVVERMEFAVNLMQVGRDEKLHIAINTGEPVIVSPAYYIFRVKKDSTILPEYLYLFMKRSNTDRYASFISDSNVRSNVEWGRFVEIKIPVPPIDVQKSIIAVHHALEMRKNLNERIKATIKEISPVLIKNAKDLCSEN